MDRANPLLEWLEIMKMKIDALEKKIGEKTNKIKNQIHNLEEMICHKKSTPVFDLEKPMCSSTSINSY